MKKLHLSRNRMIGGVAAGLAETLKIDISIMRVAWAISSIFWGFGVVAYVICWIVFPEDETPAE